MKFNRINKETSLEEIKESYKQNAKDIKIMRKELEKDVDKFWHEIMCICKQDHLYIGDFSEDQLNDFRSNCYFMKENGKKIED